MTGVVTAFSRRDQRLVDRDRNYEPGEVKVTPGCRTCLAFRGNVSSLTRRFVAVCFKGAPFKGASGIPGPSTVTLGPGPSGRIGNAKKPPSLPAC
jgi:hypothetical protein